MRQYNVVIKKNNASNEKIKKKHTFIHTYIPTYIFVFISTPARCRATLKLKKKKEARRKK